MRKIVSIMAAMVLLTTGILSAQTKVAEINDVDIDGFEVVGFTLTKGAEIDIEAVGVRAPRSREWAAYAWGIGLSSWLIDKGILLGDPAADEIWRQFDSIVERQYEDAFGKLWPADAVATCSRATTGTI